jgi:hypothetical protein
MSSNQRKILVNAFSVSMLNFSREATVRFRRLSIEELRSLLSEGEIISYIRHVSTAQILQELVNRQIQPNNGIYTYKSGDVVIMVVLNVPARGQEVVPKPEDLSFYLVEVLSLE